MQKPKSKGHGNGLAGVSTATDDSPHAASGALAACVIASSAIAGLLLVTVFLFYPLIITFLQAVKGTLVSLPTGSLILLSMVFLASGLVKGIAGIGMGLIAVPVISFVYGPAVAVALIPIPLLVTNFHQGVLTGKPGRVLRTYRPLATSMLVSMPVVAYFSTTVSETWITYSLGFTALGFVLLNLGFKLPEISSRHDRALQVTTGLVAGVVGGISGLAVIPLVCYMMLRKLDKNSFVAVGGLLLFLSGAILLVSHLSNGLLNRELMLLSAYASAAAMVGILLGEKARAYVGQELFRKLILVLIFAIGIKLLLG